VAVWRTMADCGLPNGWCDRLAPPIISSWWNPPCPAGTRAIRSHADRPR